MSINIDIHLFQTRDEQWKARIEYADKQLFTNGYIERWKVYEAVERKLQLENIR